MNHSSHHKKRPPQEDASQKAPAKKRQTLDSSLVLTDTRVWNPVAKSGLLTLSELGCLLLLTSKSIAQDHENRQDLYKLLCVNHWGTPEQAATMMQVTEMTPEDCFYKLVRPQKKAFSLPTLQYAPKDYVLIVEVRKLDDELLFCQAIKGEDIPDFFEKGKIEVDLNHPVEDYMCFDELCSDDSWTIDEVMDMFPVHTSWKGHARLMRRQDRKVIQLLSISNRDEEIDRDPNDDTIWGGPDDGVFADSFAELQILGICSNHVLFEQLNDADPEEAHLGVDLNLKYEIGVEKASLTLKGFQLSVGLCSHDDGTYLEEKLRGTDIQFAHFLESLQEWNES